LASGLFRGVPGAVRNPFGGPNKPLALHVDLRRAACGAGLL